jgi:hypothetical protein
MFSEFYDPGNDNPKPELRDLSTEFAKIGLTPGYSLSLAAVQHYLLEHKSNAKRAVGSFPIWLKQQGKQVPMVEQTGEC